MKNKNRSKNKQTNFFWTTLLHIPADFQVIFKMDVNGHGLAVDLADLSKLTKLKLHEFTQEKFRHMCILSGCDYLPSVKGIGLQTAIKLLRKSANVEKVSFYHKVNQFLNISLMNHI